MTAAGDLARAVQDTDAETQNVDVPVELVWIAAIRKGITYHRPARPAEIGLTRCGRSMRTGAKISRTRAAEFAEQCPRCWPTSTVPQPPLSPAASPSPEPVTPVADSTTPAGSPIPDLAGAPTAVEIDTPSADGTAPSLPLSGADLRGSSPLHDDGNRRGGGNPQTPACCSSPGVGRSSGPVQAHPVPLRVTGECLSPGSAAARTACECVVDTTHDAGANVPADYQTAGPTGPRAFPYPLGTYQPADGRGSVSAVPADRTGARGPGSPLADMENARRAINAAPYKPDHHFRLPQPSGPPPFASPGRGPGYTTPGAVHCNCDWLGEGTPTHDRSALCLTDWRCSSCLAAFTRGPNLCPFCGGEGDPIVDPGPLPQSDLGDVPDRYPAGMVPAGQVRLVLAHGDNHQCNGHAVDLRCVAGYLIPTST